MSSCRVGPFAFLLTPLLFLQALPAPVELSGTIHDPHGRPVAGALVRTQGQPACSRSDREGRFRLPAAHRGDRPVTAAKLGYRIAALAGRIEPLRLRLVPLPAEDNDDYRWIEPSPDMQKLNNCANCHQEIHREWAGSGHAHSAANPRFLALVEGSQPGWNLRGQHPLGVGVCAACHAPTFRDPSLEFDYGKIPDVVSRSVHCDFCHKIADAPTDKLGTNFGRFAYDLLRPREDDLLTFGPLDDAVRQGESFAFSPLYKESRYCASCHEGVIFGVHVYGTYSEWLQSPARARGQECQSCHMAPTGKMVNIAPGHGGIDRDPRTLASHAFPGGTVEMLRRSLDMNVDVKEAAGQVQVAVTLRARDVGHRVPTGFIDRHLVLIVEAVDGRGRPVAAVAGPVLPRAAGDGFAGKAGYLYAKVLTDDAGTSPLPFWLPAAALADTRLHPERPDRRVFSFPPSAQHIRTRLLHRRLWPQASRLPGNEITIFDVTRGYR